MSWKDFVENVTTPGFMTEAVEEFKQINRELCDDLADVFRNEGKEVADSISELVGKSCVAVATQSMDAFNDPTTEPVPGTPVYVLFNAHKQCTGIYAGDGNVVYQDRFGFIQTMDMLSFATDMETMNQPDHVYCCCNGDESEAPEDILARALKLEEECPIKRFESDMEFVWYALTGEEGDFKVSLQDIKDRMIGIDTEWRPWVYEQARNNREHVC